MRIELFGPEYRAWLFGYEKSENCIKGTYQDEEGKTSCKPCPHGKYGDVTGGTSLNSCKKNYPLTKSFSILFSYSIFSINLLTTSPIDTIPIR